MRAADYQRHEPELVSLVPKDWPRSETAREPIALPQAAMLDRPHRHESEVVSLVLPRAAEVTGSDEGLRSPVFYGPPDQPVERPHEAPVVAPVAKSSIHISSDDQVAHDTPRIRGKVSRSIARLCIAGVLGAGTAIAWRSYGDQVGEMVNSWAKPIDRLLFASSAKSPPPVVSGQSAPSRSKIEAASRAVSEIRSTADQIVAKREQADSEPCRRRPPTEFETGIANGRTGQTDNTGRRERQRDAASRRAIQCNAATAGS